MRKVQPIRPEKLLYSRADAAYALSLSIRTIDYKIANQELRTVRVGRKVLIPASEIRRFASGNHPGAIAA